MKKSYSFLIICFILFLGYLFLSYLSKINKSEYKLEVGPMNLNEFGKMKTVDSLVITDKVNLSDYSSVTLKVHIPKDFKEWKDHDDLFI